MISEERFHSVFLFYNRHSKSKQRRWNSPSLKTFEGRYTRTISDIELCIRVITSVPYYDDFYNIDLFNSCVYLRTYVVPEIQRDD